MLQNRTKEEILLIVLFALSFLALVDGIYLTYQHYGTSTSSLCKFGESFDCNIVSKSAYSTVDNIFYFLAVDLGWPVPIITISVPIAIIAIVAFLLIKIGIFHVWHKRSIGRFTHKHIMSAIRILLIFSLLYGVWLIYIQKFILQTFCFYCLVLDVLIFLALTVSLWIDVERI